jgi:hypothetical protein
MIFCDCIQIFFLHKQRNTVHKDVGVQIAVGAHF